MSSALRPEAADSRHGAIVLNALFSVIQDKVGEGGEASIECLRCLLLHLHHPELVTKIFKEADFE